MLLPRANWLRKPCAKAASSSGRRVGTGVEFGKGASIAGTPGTSVGGVLQPAAAGADAPTAGGNGRAAGLYPAIYTVKLGACTETSPSQNQVDLSNASAGVTTVSVPMGAVTINLTKSGVPFGGTKTVTVTHSGVNTGCLTPETYTFPATATGTKILVPYGAWNVTVPTTTAAAPTTTQAVTVSSTISTAGTNFAVTS